jgi:hypothetical protein
VALNIKNEEVVALVKKLAARRGTDMTEAIKRAVMRELAADERVDEREYARRIQAIRKIQEEFAKLPVLDPRPVQEIIDEMYEGME